MNLVKATLAESESGALYALAEQQCIANLFDYVAALHEIRDALQPRSKWGA